MENDGESYRCHLTFFSWPELMGELGVEGSNGGAEQRPDSGSGWNSAAPPDPASLRDDCLSAAEVAAQQLLSCIYPTLDSEEERRDIIDYVVRLIKSHLNCEVFPYGSVPLKTYLPDGDIDFTAINANESLSRDVFALLQMEEKNVIAEFKVKDTQYIDAEVKLVKCLVRNTVVDISFNQLGGLSALCFLEQVDRLVGRNHLFKRSIILIKAWCYYESRILGAHHGLISTYALETLVLYIFQLYHSSFGGPLVVLYRFLEYYSKFDWDNYCISLKGPVCKSSLPDIVVKVPDGWTGGLMFREEFLDNCIDMFSVSSRALEAKPKAFQPKNLNIIDPLRENNNLGRSVHLGNFYRIRSAFKYGARKLGEVLSLPLDKIADEIHKFFSNVVARHGDGIRNSIRHLGLEFGDEESLTASLSPPVKFISVDSILNGNDGVRLESKNVEPCPRTGSEGWYRTGVNSGHHSPVETYDVNTSGSSLRKSILGSPYHASHSNYSTPWNHCQQQFCFSNLSAENGSTEYGNFLKNDPADSASQKYDFNTWLVDRKEHWEANNRYQQCMDGSLIIYTTNLGSSATKAYNLDDLSFDSKDWDFTNMGDSEAFNPLADLTGDYDSHIRSLLYGQLYNGFSLSAVAHLTPFWWVPLSAMTIQSVPSEQHNQWAARSAPPAYGFCSEAQMAQGSVLHLPPPNGSLRETQTQWRSTHNGSGCRDQFNRQGQINGSYTASVVKKKENNRHEVLPGKGGSQHERKLDAKRPSPRPVGNENRTDGDLSGSWRIEFGSIGNLAEEVISASADTRGSTPGASPETRGRTAVMEQERFVAEQPIHLINEAEFPPLGCKTH